MYCWIHNHQSILEKASILYKNDISLQHMWILNRLAYKTVLPRHEPFKQNENSLLIALFFKFIINPRQTIAYNLKYIHDRIS